MDRVSKSKRSWMMSKVKSKDTNPEMIVRRIVFMMGFRYRLHQKNLPGSPDLVLKSRRKIIFVNGCFWHRHEGCAKAALPNSRVEFWTNKLERNQERDAENVEKLDADGWSVLTVWECETNDQIMLENMIKQFLVT